MKATGTDINSKPSFFSKLCNLSWYCRQLIRKTYSVSSPKDSHPYVTFPFSASSYNVFKLHFYGPVSIVFPGRVFSLWKPRPRYETKERAVSLELLMQYAKSLFIQFLLMSCLQLRIRQIQLTVGEETGSFRENTDVVRFVRETWPQWEMYHVVGVLIPSRNKITVNELLQERIFSASRWVRISG
jgi:hypothetical protein